MSERAKEYYRIATWVLVALCGLYAVALRLYLAWDLPLWLDESWTAIISAAPTFQSFGRQIWLDINAPLHYLLMWVWPFKSSLGLKLPSLLFLLAASALAVWWRPPGLDRPAGVFWGLLLLLWQPGLSLFIDARYYALLFFLGTAQTIAFLKLLDQPRRRRAILWTGIATLAILTHYFAAVPTAVQGLYFLWYHKGRAVRCWPALLTTLPGLAWGFIHLPRLRLYARPENNWYQTLLPVELPDHLAWPVAGTAYIAVGVIAIALAFRSRERIAPHVLTVAGLAFASVAMFVAAGLVVPFFAARYLLPTAPPILLAIAVSIRSAGYLPMALWYFVNLGGVVGVGRQLDEQANYGLEKPARLLPEARTVTWMMDYEGSKNLDRGQMEAMLADAFRRNHRSVRPRWSNDLFGGDGLIYFYPPDQQADVAAIKARWRCIDLVSHDHRGVVCAPRHERERQ